MAFSEKIKKEIETYCNNHLATDLWYENEFYFIQNVELRNRIITEFKAIRFAYKLYEGEYYGAAGFFRNCPSYSFSNISLAVNNSLPQRPYMVRFIIFNLLFVPSTKPFDRGLATAFSTADKSFSSPDAKRESSFKSLFLYFSIKRYKYGMFFF